MMKAMKSGLDGARLAAWAVGGQSRTLGVKSLSSPDKRFEGGFVVSLDDPGVVYLGHIDILSLSPGSDCCISVTL